ncbi:hypothetical protein PV08_00837 [Exophiala spinifera]|uniref:Exonuclease domain-containing protein n=1 Tax=Exophiala spinifera TaxID=91928 RepID=A0A0D2A645_9EURO|nr:uncharacterized protein PV08_00837 [Exophiala spinifera]KIW20262.1 hypothetical protein PV08_00837 [Exophiala spinifera]
MAQSASGDIVWSAIQETPATVEALRSLCHSRDQLKEQGYTLEPLSADQIEAKTRCVNCRGEIVSLWKGDLLTVEQDESNIITTNLHWLRNLLRRSHRRTGARKETKLTFTCCGKHVSQPGCVHSRDHTLPPSNEPFNRQYWQHYPTPRLDQAMTPRSRNRRGQLVMQPYSIHRLNPFTAIALDCEMGVSFFGESELIRVTAVDFFSGNILVDNLVQPEVPMLHYNTRYSGVTRGDIQEAIRRGTCIFGKDRAREMLWRYVGPDTIVIVHGGRGDLSELRWLHGHIVDSFILESMTGAEVKGGKSLKNLCKVKLGIDVQRKGRLGHDSLEDAMACRELVIDWIEKIGHNWCAPAE